MAGKGYRPFESTLRSLRERLQNREQTRKVPPDRSKDGPTDEELFQRAMEEVREIKEFRKIPYRSPRRMAPPLPPSDDEPLRILREITEGRLPLPLPDLPEYVEWVNPGLRRDLSEMLHGGEVAVQDWIDLHGFRVEEARAEVSRFLRDSLRKGLRCIKIIHGRGLRSAKGPVLKKAVTGWLERDFRKYVAAYVTARACDGGLGAIYVLLRS